MNRKIKFRMKDKQGEWQYVEMTCSIIEALKDPVTTGGIDENTIGQYIGFHDRFGDEIYESDIVYVRSEDENARRWGLRVFREYESLKPGYIDIRELISKNNNLE